MSTERPDTGLVLVGGGLCWPAGGSLAAPPACSGAAVACVTSRLA